MTKSDVALIVLRSMAIYILLIALSVVSFGITIIDIGASSFLPQFFIMGILAVILWFVAPFVAMLMVKKIERPIDKDMFRSKFHVESTIFTIVGLILVITSITPLIFNLAYYNTEDIQLHIADEGQRVMMQASQNGWTAAYTFKLIVGLLLVLFAEPFWQFLDKIKAKLIK